MKNSKYLILSFFIIIISSINAQAYVKYYKNVMLDGRYDIVGLNPVTEEESMKTSCYHLFYNDNGKMYRVKYMASGKLKIDPFWRVAQVDVKYYDNTYVKRSFYNEKSKPMPSKNNVYSVRLKLNSNGCPISLYNYDKFGLITDNSNGVAHYFWYVDKKGRRIKSFRFDGKGKRIIDKQGMFELRYKYDENDFLAELTIIGLDGKLMDNIEGYAIVRWKYDENGNRIESSYYSAENKMVVSTEKFSRVQYTYDSKGNMLEERYFDEKGVLMENIENFSYILYKYDQNRNEIERSYYGVYGQYRDYKGYAVVQSKYDEFGGVVEQKYFGIDGQEKEYKDGKVCCQ